MNIETTLSLLFAGLRRMPLVAAVAMMSIINPASGAQIGLKLGVNGNGGLQTSFLLPDQPAGAPGYEQTNWMTLGRWGDNGSGQFNVVDSSGANTGITLQWDATGNWSVQNTGTPSDLADPQVNLMNPYDDSNNGGNVPLTNGLPNGVYGQAGANKPLVYLSGLTNWLASQGVSYYDLIIYSDGDNQGGRCGEYWIQHASGPITNIIFDTVSPTPGVDMTTHVFIRDFNNFHLNPAFQQVPLSSNNGRVAGSGNYGVFTGLSADSLLIRTAEFNTRAPINALQIVPRASASGATLEPLPASQTYAGGRASFRVKAGGVVPMSFQWQKNGAPLSDAGNVSGSTTATLNLASVSGTDAGNYSVVVSNASGVVTSTVAPLTVASPAAGSYAEKIFTNNPVAYWRLNETGDPSTNNSPAYDSVGGFNALYGPLAQNGYTPIAGPRPAEFPGFEAGNAAMQTAFANTTPLPYPSSYVSWAVAPPLNLNTNTVTLCAWIYPVGNQAGAAAILFQRTGSDTSGFGYGNYNNLGYTWNNAGNTFGFGFGSPGYPELGLVPPSNQWSFVACVITPSNAVLYLLNTNGQFSATNTVDHTNGVWANLTMIGDDPNSTGIPQNRAFNGSIDEVAVFNRSLAPAEIFDLYKKGLQTSLIPPVIAAQPASLALLAGRTARFAVTASGEAPLTYQWRTNGVNLTDGGNVSGATSPRLTITGVTSANAGGYDVVVGNTVGSIPSSVASLTVVASNAAAPYEARLRAANPIAYWRLNEANGSANSYDYWGGNNLANANVTLGVSGPVPPEYSGIESTNTAGQFDGVSSYSATTAGLMNNLAQFSVVGWFNAPAVVGQRVGLSSHIDVVELGFHANGADGVAQLGVYTPRGSTFLNQSTNVFPGVWYFVAAVGTGTNVNLYLASTNGAGGVTVVQSSTTHAATTNYGAAPFPFRIGGGGGGTRTTNYFNGQIDEVAVFNRAISSSEFSDLFGAAFSGGDLPPTISAEPASQTLYAGRTATFSVTALGTSPQYRWRKDNVPLSDGGGISGATTPTLTIANVLAANQGVYDLVVTNRVGSITSGVASLTVITPIPDSHESAVVALHPVSYYRLNEPDDPSGGTAIANDFWGGHNGAYGIFAQNGFSGIAGPRPSDGFGVFESTNAAFLSANGIADSYVTVPPLGITTNTLTITAWINPSSYADARMGLVFARAGQPATGLNFNGTNLNYHWLDAAATYGWDSGLNPPLNQWSFVALVVEPAQATIHLINTNGAQSAVNVFAHADRAFTDNIRIGGDPNSNTGRTFSGAIDEVAIFPYALSPSQIQSLYLGVAAVEVSVQRVGANIVLTWPQGTLLEANEVTGPYTTNNAASPYTNSPAAAKKFFKVIVK